MKPKTVSLLVIAKDKAAVDARIAAKKATDTAASDTSSASEAVKKNSAIGWIVGGAAAVLAAVGDVIVGITNKRKAK